MLPIGIADFYLIVFPLVFKVVQHGDLLFSMLHNIIKQEEQKREREEKSLFCNEYIYRSYIALSNIEEVL